MRRVGTAVRHWLGRFIFSDSLQTLIHWEWALNQQINICNPLEYLEKNQWIDSHLSHREIFFPFPFSLFPISLFSQISCYILLPSLLPSLVLMEEIDILQSSLSSSSHSPLSKESFCTMISSPLPLSVSQILLLSYPDDRRSALLLDSIATGKKDFPCIFLQICFQIYLCEMFAP